MRKNLRLVVALIVGIPLLALLALFLLVDPQKLSPALVAQLSKSLGRNTSIEKLDYKLFPPSFRATNLVIADDPAFSDKPFLKAADLEIRPAILPLFSGRLELQSVRIIEPVFELIENSRGIWNFDSIGGSSQSSEPNSLSLTQLIIEKANLGIKRPDTARDLYSNLSAELRDYAQAKPFSLKLAAQMPSGKAIEAAGTITSAGGKTTFSQFTLTLASLKASLEGEVSSSAMNIEVKIPKSPIADAAPLFLHSSMAAKGDVVAGIKITGSPKAPVLNGRLDITGFEVSGGEIKQPVKTAKLSLALTPERIMLEPANVSSGSTQLQTFGVISNYARAPRLEATLIAPDAQIAELLSIARAYGMSSVEGIKATGQAKVQIRASGLLEARTPLAFSGTGSLRNANIVAPSITKPIEISSTDFRFEANSASLSGVHARLASSNIEGDCKISNFKSPALEFNLEADKVLLDEIRSLMPEAKSKGDSPAKITASGSLKIGTLQLAELTLTQLTAQANYRDGHFAIAPLNASL
ncbi:MAG: AsmA family protein [Acidobacteria bacterium]|nr:AsmA family protein [Acidobacteriota bacterium]